MGTFCNKLQQSGVHYVAAPGHSPSHASILFTSGSYRIRHRNGDHFIRPEPNIQIGNIIWRKFSSPGENLVVREDSPLDFRCEDTPCTCRINTPSQRGSLPMRGSLTGRGGGNPPLAEFSVGGGVGV